MMRPLTVSTSALMSPSWAPIMSNSAPFASGAFNRKLINAICVSVPGSSRFVAAAAALQQGARRADRPAMDAAFGLVRGAVLGIGSASPNAARNTSAPRAARRRWSPGPSAPCVRSGGRRLRCELHSLRPPPPPPRWTRRGGATATAFSPAPRGCKRGADTREHRWGGLRPPLPPTSPAPLRKRRSRLRVRCWSLARPPWSWKAGLRRRRRSLRGRRRWYCRAGAVRPTSALAAARERDGGPGLFSSLAAARGVDEDVV